MGTAIQHPVPYRIKPSFVIFDIRALWRWDISVRVAGCQKLQMTAGLTRSGTGCSLSLYKYGNSWRQKINLKMWIVTNQKLMSMIRHDDQSEICHRNADVEKMLKLAQSGRVKLRRRMSRQYCWWKLELRSDNTVAAGDSQCINNTRRTTHDDAPATAGLTLLTAAECRTIIARMLSIHTTAINYHQP